MEFYDEKIKQLAIEIYELDAEVYENRTCFTAERDICIRNIMEDLHSRQKSSHVRSELALISNMARTIKDKKYPPWPYGKKYDKVLNEIKELPTSFCRW